MSHWPILPILIPLGAAVLCLLPRGPGPALQRTIAAASVLAQLWVAIVLLRQAADGSIAVYPLGDWPAPYGIVLVVDGLSAIMVAIVAALALAVLIHAMAGTDTGGRHFHPLLQFQLAGLNGAFLTGDLFNLFVFFEILLLASYALLVHGAGRGRPRPALAYVVLNLTGSALFLVALGLLYGTLGTLNLADMAGALARVEPDDQALVRAAAALLTAVFLLKAALLPLSFWLPHVYGAAAAPVAALFAIMTKVGVYALLRVSAIGFAASPMTGDLLAGWLPALALLTIASGSIGALAASRFAAVVTNLILVSTGTLLVAVAAGTPAATAAALYYLPHTTLVTAGLFLLGDAIARERGELADAVAKGPRLTGLAALGAAYLVLGLAISGVPPLSGFLGKLMVMRSVAPAPLGAATWAALLLSGLIAALVLARAASAFFWEPGKAEGGSRVLSPPPPAGRRRALAALALLALASPALTIGAAPVADYARRAAEQLHARQPYIAAVLGDREIQRERRP